jgi:2,3-bisphosphoglycerate-dependent phosphoglycerate mutase
LLHNQPLFFMPSLPTQDCELWLVRHGETDWNAAHRMQGRTDIALNAVGQAQALALLPMLTGAHTQRAFAALYATPLRRAQQTAAPIANALALPVGIVVDLQERAFGVIEGQPYATVRDGVGATPELTIVAQAMHRRELDYLPPIGASGQSETLRQFYRRTVQAAQHLAAAHSGQRILVVSHGGVLDCLWRWANGVAIDAPRRWSVVNASVNVLRIHAANHSVDVLAWGVQADRAQSLALDDIT